MTPPAVTEQAVQVERIRRLALSYARRLCPAALGDTEREDCAAAAWEAGWRAGERGQPVRTAVWRACLGHVRSVVGRRGERLVCSHLDYILASLDDADHCALLATQERGYADVRARALIARLPNPRTAEVIRRRVLDRETERDVSEALGISVDMARYHHRAGLRQLHALLNSSPRQ